MGSGPLHQQPVGAADGALRRGGARRARARSRRARRAREPRGAGRNCAIGDHGDRDSARARRFPPTTEERIADARAATMADSIMYREALADAADARGWAVNWYDSEHVFQDAAAAPAARTSTLFCKRWVGRSAPLAGEAQARCGGGAWGCRAIALLWRRAPALSSSHCVFARAKRALERADRGRPAR